MKLLNCKTKGVFFSVSTAVVSVTLNNVGRDAYKQDVYGQTIGIEQKITREGLRTYKLKNHSGNVNI